MPAPGLGPGSTDAQLTPEMLLHSYPGALETWGGHVAGTALPLSLDGRKGLDGGRQPEMAAGHSTPRPPSITHSRTSHLSLAMPQECCVTLPVPLILCGQLFFPTCKLGVGLGHHGDPPESYLLIHYLILSGPCWHPHFQHHVDFPLALLTVISLA